MTEGETLEEALDRAFEDGILLGRVAFERAGEGTWYILVTGDGRMCAQPHDDDGNPLGESRTGSVADIMQAVIGAEFAHASRRVEES